MLWGHLKIPVPEVGDTVMVFVGDALNQNLYYLPMPSIEEAESDSDDQDTFFIGKDASESAVLGDTLKAKLDSLFDELAQMLIPSAMGPCGPPINAPQMAAIKALLSEILSATIKVK